MAKNMKCHELVRMFMNVFTAFLLNGDPEWVVRSCRDEAIMMARRLHEAYAPLFTNEYANAYGALIRAEAAVSFCSTRVYYLIQVSLFMMTMMTMMMMMMMMLMMMVLMTMMMLMMTTTRMMIMMMGWWWW